MSSPCNGVQMITLYIAIFKLVAITSIVIHISS
jgi:hypothetical protein